MDKQSIDQFHLENEKLIHFASRKALKRFAAAGLEDRIEYEEIFGNLTEIFLKSYKQFDPERSKFSTYFVSACHNFVTNQLEKMFRLEVKTDAISAFGNDSADGEKEIQFDEALGEDPMFEDQIALESEINHMFQNLSPFAQILFKCSINPPQFVLDAFYAQRAQSALASSLGLHAWHSREIDLQFVANILGNTATNPETVKHLKKAVIEVKQAVMRTVSAQSSF